MQIAPDKSKFLETYTSGVPQVAWSRVSGDLETTVSAYLKLADGKPNSFILESVEGGETRGRYSFVGINPDLIWRCRRHAAWIAAHGLKPRWVYGLRHGALNGAPAERA
jgi:anthranilate synthase component 1